MIIMIRIRSIVAPVITMQHYSTEHMIEMRIILLRKMHQQQLHWLRVTLENSGVFCTSSLVVEVIVWRWCSQDLPTLIQEAVDTEPEGTATGVASTVLCSGQVRTHLHQPFP